MTVSVIIPIFNQEIFLEECLESVMNQDYGDYEVLLINDGSTDHSEEVCQKYAEKYSCIRYIYQPNAGLGEARNTGLRNAIGKYVLFLDSDDAIQRNSIEKIVHFAERKNADIVYFDEIVCEEDLCVRSVARTYSEMDAVIPKTKALELSMHPAHIWARMYRKSLFDNTVYQTAA